MHSIISYNIFNIFVHEAMFHGMEFSICGFGLVLRKFRFWSNLDFWLKDAQPVVLSETKILLLG